MNAAGRYGVLTMGADGENRITLANTREDATALRLRLEAAGTETYSLVRVVSETDAKVNA